jgi:hypothetical protein
MWIWDAGAPQLAIGVPRIRILPHVHITYLSCTSAFPLCRFVYICSRSTWLCAVKCAPCHVIETRMPHVMDSRVVSRGLCFTLGNPEPRPSYLTMIVAASLVHPLQLSEAHLTLSPLDIGHKLILSSPLSGSRIPYHGNAFSSYLCLALLSSSFALLLRSSKS